MTLQHLVALALAAVVGFAAHRASLCTVKACAEVITSGTAYMFASFGRAALWAAAVAGVTAQFVPIAGIPLVSPAPGLAIAGGFLFGVGAAINGGCSLSTLQRLVDGEFSMLATVAGLLLGIALAGAVQGSPLPQGDLQAVAPRGWGGELARPLLAGLFLWCAIEAARLLGPALRSGTLVQALGNQQYRPAVAAAIMGIAAGGLYPLQGAWTYTNYLRREVGAWFAVAVDPLPFHALLVVALIAGMVLSSWQRRSFRLRLTPSMAMARSAAGGLLMGIGATFIPGGNDTLLLAAIPGLSPWALATYLSLLAGVACVFLVMRYVSGTVPRVRCGEDGCD